MKILVTGSEGFIGRHLARRLRAGGHEILGLSRRPADEAEASALSHLSLDVTDREALRRGLAGTALDAVVHLAGMTTHAELTEQRYLALRANTTGIMNVLDAFLEAGARRFLYASSGKVYGRIRSLPIDESHPVEPRNVLGKMKAVAERVIDAYVGAPAHQFVSARIFNVYGPGQRDYFLLPTILNQLGAGVDELFLGNTEDRRDFVFIDDVVAALETCLTASLDDGFHALNVGSGRPTSPAEIVAVLARLLERPLTVRQDPSRFRGDEDPVEYAAIARLEALSWRPMHDLEAGLGKTIPHYLEPD